MLSDQQLEWLGKMLSKAAREKFTGSITLNFFQGGISNINKGESIKVPSQAELVLVG